VYSARGFSLASTPSGGEGWGEEVLLKRLISGAWFFLNRLVITLRVCGAAPLPNPPRSFLTGRGNRPRETVRRGHVCVYSARGFSLSSTPSGGEGWGEEVLLKRLISGACFFLNRLVITLRVCEVCASRASP
jgi:hypothetical protein